ncbi:MAG: hypothetical protein K2Q20_07535 [Phycisphaerales bacterium]|nr:hypothetical protein [Phycisphaerales bacterium]
MTPTEPVPTREHDCAGCGYDLTGLTHDARCPECGRRPTPQHPVVDLDVRGVDLDIACVSCNYNLRGLDPHGRCPECGRPIRKSLPRGRGFTPAECRQVARHLARMLAAGLVETAGIVAVGLVWSGIAPGGEIAIVAAFAVILAAAVTRTRQTILLTRVVISEVEPPNGPGHAPAHSLGKPGRRGGIRADLRWLASGPAVVHAACTGTVCVLGAFAYSMDIGPHLGLVLSVTLGLAVLSATTGGLATLTLAEQIAIRSGWPRHVKALEDVALSAMVLFVLGIFVLGLGPVVAYLLYQVVLWTLFGRVRSRFVHG